MVDGYTFCEMTGFFRIDYLPKQSYISEQWFTVLSRSGGGGGDGSMDRKVTTHVTPSEKTPIVSGKEKAISGESDRSGLSGFITGLLGYTGRSKTWMPSTYEKRSVPGSRSYVTRETVKLKKINGEESDCQFPKKVAPTPGPVKVLLDDVVRDPPKDFLAPPLVRRRSMSFGLRSGRRPDVAIDGPAAPALAKSHRPVVPNAISQFSHALFQGITKRTAPPKNLGEGSCKKSVPWAAEQQATNGSDVNHMSASYATSSPNAEDEHVNTDSRNGVISQSPIPAVMKAVHSGLWNRPASSGASIQREKNDPAPLLPLRKSYPLDITAKDVQTAVPSKKVPRATLEHMLPAFFSQDEARRLQSARSQRAAVAAAAGLGEPPSSLASEPAQGLPASPSIPPTRRIWKDAQR